MAGVSQPTVSLVLNGRVDADIRIPQETRERVLRAIRESGYVPDPVARRLAARNNRILGVFTYEAVFPSDTSDFYHPFLVGIEEAAEQAGCDLLLLTSASVTGGRRRVLEGDNRLRLADGCLLLGRSLDRDDLRRMVADGYPFVAVGRRDDAGGPVPYVGADYATAVGRLVQLAVTRGHRRVAYLGLPADVESSADRRRGLLQATQKAEGSGVRVVSDELSPAREPDELLTALLAVHATVVLVEHFATAVGLVSAAERRGLAVPADLSVVTLGDPTTPVPTDVDFTGFHIPREEMGRQAVALLTGLVEGTADTTQRLLPCELVDGATLAPPLMR
ncbi:LacI family DNA-binding transcriptional regulator [Streptomyces sp. PSKA54]|uniref:LacI family DNA-binding transcriptional regulator n=1 Tax=Streptomyces himalayensis subsp. aureolus TaxID=2758039 RepID=A0A7W2HH88_9ACTN|nr:LacI family DNA-binding transcriptional regulator [Streptomyces himalayensis subsp. aureolus]